MNKKSKKLFMQITSLLLIFILSITIFKEEYLFGWISHNYTFFLGLSIMAILLNFLNKNKTSLYLTLSLTLGLFIANYIGKYHRLYNIGKISDAMDAQQVASLHLNYAFVFWIMLIGLSLIIGLVLDWRKKPITWYN